jgi:hypothetical protein
MKNVFKVSLFFFFFVSCVEQKECESFDYKRIIKNISYYTKSLKYKNKSDTLELFLRNNYHSKESTWGSYGFDCNPRLEIEHVDLKNTLDISYTFEYFKNHEGNDSTYLTIIINSSMIRLNLDTIKKRLNDEITLDKIEYLTKSNYLNLVKRIKLRKMKITEIEDNFGTKWILIK